MVQLGLLGSGSIHPISPDVLVAQEIGSGSASDFALEAAIQLVVDLNFIQSVFVIGVKL